MTLDHPDPMNNKALLDAVKHREVLEKIKPIAGKKFTETLIYAISVIDELDSANNKLKTLEQPELIGGIALKQKIRIDSLEKENERLKFELEYALKGAKAEADVADEAKKEIKRLGDSEEQLRVQLAGCSVAALGYAKGKNDCKKGDYGWSVSFEDVKTLWDKYMKIWKEIEELKIETWLCPNCKTECPDSKICYDCLQQRHLELVQKFKRLGYEKQWKQDEIDKLKQRASVEEIFSEITKCAITNKTMIIRKDQLADLATAISKMRRGEIKDV